MRFTNEQRYAISKSWERHSKQHNAVEKTVQDELTRVLEHRRIRKDFKAVKVGILGVVVPKVHVKRTYVSRKQAVVPPVEVQQ